MKIFVKENYAISFVVLVTFIGSLGRDLFFIPYSILGYPFFYLNENAKNSFYIFRNNIFEPILWLSMVMIFFQIFLWIKNRKIIFLNSPLIFILMDLIFLQLSTLIEDGEFDLFIFTRNEAFFYGSMLFVNLALLFQLSLWFLEKNFKK